jgi:DNA gyrase/topoisomerase IV subunit A
MIILENVKQELEKDIKKLVGILKDEEQLTEVLKKKLTKKEFKYYKLKLEKIDENIMMQELHCDKNRFEEIKKQTILKLNQEKIKKELVL